MAVYDFNVQVDDEDGTAVATATVTVYKSDGTSAGTGTTNASGNLAAAISLDTDDNTHRITVTKTGYQSQEIYYEVYQTDTSYYIRLPAYSTTYCTPEEVAEFMFGSSFTFANSTRLTDSTVANFINYNEGLIDGYTGLSWLVNTVTDEYYDADVDKLDYDGWLTIFVDNTPLQTADATWEINNWNSTTETYTDFIADKTEGRDGDYYFDYDRNIINIKPLYYGENVFKLTYKYGESTVPEDIKLLCILRTAVNLIDSDDYIGNIKIGDVAIKDKRDSFNKQISTIEYSYRRKKF